MEVKLCLSRFQCLIPKVAARRINKRCLTTLSDAHRKVFGKERFASYFMNNRNHSYHQRNKIHWNIIPTCSCIIGATLSVYLLKERYLTSAAEPWGYTETNAGGVYIGLRIVPLTPDIAATLKKKYPQLPEIYGMMIQDVAHDSPAYLAGLRAGDVITTINGHSIKNFKDFQKATKICQVLNITVARNDRIMELTVYPETYVH